MTNFADHLFRDLMAEHGAELAAGPAPAPTPARRRYARPAWATAGTVAAAGAAAVGFTVFGGTAAAYAVTDNHNGTVTVSVGKPSGIAGANSKLHRMGVHAVVMQAHAGCPSILSFAVSQMGDGRFPVGTFFSLGASGKVTFVVKSGPDNGMAVMALDFGHGTPTGVLVPIKGQVPSCVSIPTDTPPGAETESSTAPSPDQHKG